MAKTIDLKALFATYGEKVIKVRCRAEGFRNSEFSTQTINNVPLVAIGDNILNVSNVLLGVESYDLYIDGVLSKSYEHDSTSTENFSIDLTEFELDPYIIYLLNIVVHVGSDTFASNSVESAKVLGVSGLYASTVALTRTDQAVDLTFAIDASTGLISSDFDNEFPYSEMKVVDIDGNAMVYIPGMYFRIGTDDDSNITDIAVSRVAVGDGDWYYTKPFYYSAYQGCISSFKLLSKSGVTPTGSYPIATFRTYAMNNGDRYHQLDLFHKTIMNFLWLIEFANKDSSSVMGGNLSGTKCNTGGTDSLTTPSGYLLSNGQMRWHYIEDFIGNMRDFLDGVNANYYATSDITLYANAFSSNKLSYSVDTTGGRCIASLGWDSTNPFLCMPKKTASNSNYNTYFCDMANVTNGSGYIYHCGASYDDRSSASIGVFYVCSSSGLANAYYGARLLYSPE